MKIFIAQNHFVPNNVSYESRSKEDLEREFKALSSKYPNADIVKDARNYPDELEKMLGYKPSTVYALGADISALSSFSKDDLVVFSRDHFYDRFCGILLQVCSAYNIPYKAEIYKAEVK